MEFWGVEIMPGQTLKLEPGENKYLHLSLASLGEIKDNVKENILIYVKVNEQKLVFATLSADKCAQIQCDLIFEKEFELSHSSKSTNIYLSGYKTLAVDNELSDLDDSDLESDEDVQLQKANGEPVVKVGQAKPAAGKPNILNTDVSAAKAKPKAEEQKGGKQKENEDNDDDESDDDEDFDGDFDEDESDDEDMAEAEDDSEDEDEGNSDEEDEATVKNAKPSNKRKADAALKTPVPEKKAKIASGMAGVQKKGGAGKKDDNSGKKNGKAKQQSPKLAGSVTCKFV